MPKRTQPVVLPSVLQGLKDAEGGLFKVAPDGRIYRKCDGGYALAAQYMKLDYRCWKQAVAERNGPYGKAEAAVTIEEEQHG